MTPPTDIPIISVRNLSKTYQIGGPREKYKRLSESVTDALLHPRKWLSSRTNTRETFYALRDVSFDVYPGEVVGIIGRNGAGKSTLLKILSGITYPSAGEIELNGRVGSLLEVGTGFHPELTGRENIYFNGSVLGMTRREIDDKFDEIVTFAGIDEFLDTPVKRYSSGMTVRLGFAVAAHLEPEILVVDEVLAVGDAEFQKKCLGKMQEVSEGGRTVLFVSHNMAAVSGLCNRAVLLDRGEIASEGLPDDVIQDYLQGIKSDQTLVIPDYSFPRIDKILAQITRIRIMNEKNELSLSYDALESITFIINFEVYTFLPHLVIWFELRNKDNITVFTSGDSDLILYSCSHNLESFSKKPGLYETCVSIPAPLLNEGSYEFEIYLTTGPTRIDTKRNIFFEVVDHGSFITGLRNSPRGGIIVVPLKWDLRYSEND